MELNGVDFIDFGASEGGSIQFARERLGGVRGVGIDICPDKVATMRERGYECIEGDITRLDLPESCVRFVTMSHILEHLPDHDTAEKVIEAGLRLVTDFVYIQGPYFDADEYLESHGLKFYWSDWSGHPCHLKISDLEQMFERMGVTDYEFLVLDEVVDSSDPAIHSLDSPRNQHAYDASKHPPKAQITFDRPIWREMICIVRARALDDMSALYRARSRSKLLDRARLDWTSGSKARLGTSSETAVSRDAGGEAGS